MRKKRHFEIWGSDSEKISGSGDNGMKVVDKGREEVADCQRGLPLLLPCLTSAVSRHRSRTTRLQCHGHNRGRNRKSKCGIAKLSTWTWLRSIFDDTGVLILKMGGFFHDVLEGRVRDVRKWVEGGQKVGLYDEYGNTALHMAAEKGFRGVCKVLLDAGADVNQRNESVGWTAVHYASYEGHADVLRMLIAHGAKADIADKAGDTAEAYAREWDNEECLRVLQDALGKSRSQGARQSESKADSLCDSRDSRSASEEDSDEEDEDESSMMNWVIPPVAAQPKPVVKMEVNNNLMTSKQLGGAMEDLRGRAKSGPVEKWDEEEDGSTSSSFSKSKTSTTSTSSKSKDRWAEEDQDSLCSDNYQSVHLKLPQPPTQAKCLDEEDTESEDTLNLMKEAEKTKTKARPGSIVDRMIMGSKSPAPTQSQGIAGRGREENQRGRKLTGDDVLVVKTIEEAEIKIAAEKVRREKSASRARSASREARIRELVAPQGIEHLLGLQQASMSSATIPDNMTMSCTSILDRLGDESAETEKEALLKRLKELLEGEGRQVADDLALKKRQLEEVEEERCKRVRMLKEAHKKEEEVMMASQKQQLEEQTSRHRGEEARIGQEIAKLEDELERLAAPSQLLSSLSSTPNATISPAPPAKAELSELELELQCCSCSKVCAPPSLIFQCPEGDLICGTCKDSGLKLCPSCRLELAGQTSRNKVLEKIAKKYFKDKN